ncbi:MAG: Periplasmic thiol:disulfide interchange protein DsbA [Parcubacteria group bacterium GW2011_GWA1_47_8]|nr:MAG: Periplasmic thiol:disulfide interchange protein DsbA [Parcubacteria group bacterium GW2011_GWA1_47_8]KKW07775.1 MAG: Periplasmic thiol:disulfide interchange protein DsbA [Parcubacteria group bacterium GW2011_GWA2_49_16]
MEENNNQNTSTPANTAPNNLLVPLAIVVAGFSIAAAVYFSNQNQGQGNVASKGSAEQARGNVPPVTASDHILGNPNAKVVIVEYSDTECPFCKSFHPTMEQVMNTYGKDGQVAWVYRHFPIDARHPKARKEAEATECAAELGGNAKFWEYLSNLFKITPANDGLDPAMLPQIAKDIGLDEKAFNACLASGKYANLVEANYQGGVEAGIQGTPSSMILVNKKLANTIDGAQPYSVVKAQIDNALKNN